MAAAAPMGGVPTSLPVAGQMMMGQPGLMGGGMVAPGGMPHMMGGVMAAPLPVSSVPGTMPMGMVPTSLGMANMPVAGAMHPQVMAILNFI